MPTTTSLTKCTPPITLDAHIKIAAAIAAIPSGIFMYITAQATATALAECRLGKDCPFLSFATIGTFPYTSYGLGRFIIFRANVSVTNMKPGTSKNGMIFRFRVIARYIVTIIYNVNIQSGSHLYIITNVLYRNLLLVTHDLTAS